MIDVKLTYARVVWLIEHWFSILSEQEDGSFQIIDFKLRNYQKRALREIIENDGRNIQIEKTRQMGFSWLLAAWFALLILFSKNEQLLIVGKTEEFIDNAQVNPNTLMGKIKFLLFNLREPAMKKLAARFIEDKYMFIRNSRNGSVIQGASASGKSGRGSTFTRVWWDEVAFTQHDHELFSSISPNSRQLILLSTPHGKNNVFYNIKRRIEGGELAKQWHKIRVHWSEYFDQEWYERQKVKLGMDPVLIAQELDIDYESSSNEKVFYTFTEANFKPTVFNPELAESSILTFDFGIRDRTSGSVLQRDRENDRYFVPDCFELTNVPFELVLRALFTPSEFILGEIRQKTPAKFFGGFERFYRNAITHSYKRLVITGDPAAGQRSQLSGQSIADAILQFSKKVVFYRSDIESVLSFIRANTEKIVVDAGLTGFREMVGNYSYEVNRRGEPVAPLHNEFSHLADGFRYGMLYFRESEGRAPTYHHNEGGLFSVTGRRV